MEYYSAIKKNDIIAFAATWMELETLILSEISQKEKDKYHMISLISGIPNIQHKGIFPQKRESWTWRIDLWGCLMREGGRGGDRELGVIRYNLEQIYKQILLSSIENYV